MAHAVRVASALRAAPSRAIRVRARTVRPIPCSRQTTGSKPFYPHFRVSAIRAQHMTRLKTICPSFYPAFKHSVHGDNYSLIRHSPARFTPRSTEWESISPESESACGSARFFSNRGFSAGFRGTIFPFTCHCLRVCARRNYLCGARHFLCVRSRTVSPYSNL